MDPPAGEAVASSRPEQGHRVLARLGKRVLRPGGLGLTRWLLSRLAIGAWDRVVVLGPGVGRTAQLLLAARPEHYLGVEPNPMAREALATVVPAWRQVLEGAGLEILEVRTAAMALLEPRRLVQDEGLVGAARFVANVARDRDARRRVLGMRASFRAHRDQLAAVALVARKPREMGVTR